MPVRGLFVLVLLFALGIGPVNLWLLSKYKRRIWLWWNVPAISLLMLAFTNRFLALITGALLLAATLAADTLVLRDGRRIQGQLISVRDGVIEFQESPG